MTTYLANAYLFLSKRSRIGNNQQHSIYLVQPQLDLDDGQAKEEFLGIDYALKKSARSRFQARTTTAVRKAAVFVGMPASRRRWAAISAIRQHSNEGENTLVTCAIECVQA